MIVNAKARITELEATCEKQGKRIAELKEEVTVTTMLAAIHLSGKRRFYERTEAAEAKIAELEEQLEEALANAEAGAYQGDQERMRAETAEAELAKLRESKDLCPVCLTWSWAPCDEGDEWAEQQGYDWVLCQCCNDSRIAVLWKGRAEELREALVGHIEHLANGGVITRAGIAWRLRGTAKAALAKGDEKC